MVGVKHIAGVKRGARVKSIAIASRHQWIHIFKPILLLTLDEFFRTPVMEVLEKMFVAINGTDMKCVPVLTRAEKRAMRATLSSRLPHYDPNFLELAPSLRYYDPSINPLQLTEESHEMDVYINILYIDR